jgi:hypothetical protein
MEMRRAGVDAQQVELADSTAGGTVWSIFHVASYKARRIGLGRL